MGPLRAAELTSVLAAAAVLGALWMALPVRLPAGGAGPSSADCLTIADQQTHDLAALERCRAIVPNDVELGADLGMAYEAAGRAGDAAAIYQQILTVDPRYADVRLRLAALLRDRGDHARARAQIDEALRVQPNRKALVDFASGLTP